MAKIIASVLARSRGQVLMQAQKAAMLGADWIELRLDVWSMQESLEPLIEAIRLPVLVACRTPEDGGSYRGTLTARRELLTHALHAGAQGLDLEQWETWTPSAGRTGLKLRIRSFHSFTGVPKDLHRIRDELSTPGTVVKLVVTAHDLADAAPVIRLLQETDQVQQPTVAFAMGRTAWPTRIMAVAMGSPLIYGSIDPQAGTVPDQPSVGLLSQLYRVGSLGPDTKWYGLLGNPAMQSLGPWLHNRAFRRVGHDGVYLPLETSRPEAVLAMLPQDRLAGVSVTAPHKERMLGACLHTSDEAAAVGVVNTMIAADGGGWHGYNTDVLAVREALQNAGALDGDGLAAVVLGSGGAARAGAYALLQLGFSVTMLARSHEPVRKFAETYGIALGSLSESVLIELNPKVIVHATPVGTRGRDEGERLLPDYTPPAGTIVHDMVYQPVRTKLLNDCLAAGAVVVPGVEMFLRQARAQVRLFAGKDLSEDVLRSFLAGSAAAMRL
ncbi:MAG: 3-dehydroquinate dehydratase/shikimate dehydrogenase [Hyphomicrobiaceae bacterium]|jgi:3-dehydroquinate dehydratase/shikimate dehydrogenase